MFTEYANVKFSSSIQKSSRETAEKQFHFKMLKLLEVLH